MLTEKINQLQAKEAEKFKSFKSCPEKELAYHAMQAQNL